MRILHLSDTHLGSTLGALGAPPGWRRDQDHLRALEGALRPALDQEVDLVVHSGDVFNRSRPPRRVVAAAVERLRAAARRVPVVLIPGNHDRRGIRRSLPSGAPGLHVLGGPTRLVFGGLALGFVPFRRDADHWAADARTAAGPGIDALVAHQAFHGAVVPGLTFRHGAQRDTVHPRQVPPGVSHVLAGHIHPRQVTRSDGVEVVYVGATERTSWAEASQPKGYALWEWDRVVRWRWVDLPARPMAWVGSEGDLEWVLDGALVRAASPELERAALERGGWVVPRRERREVVHRPRQLRLL